MDAAYVTYLSSVTWEDVEAIKKAADELRKSDPKIKREFRIRIGPYDENGSVAEEYKFLFKGTR